MSKNFKKYFFNNLKESKYLSNIDRVEFDSTKSYGNNELSDRELQKRRDELDAVQIHSRHRNMRLYMKNMLGFRCNQLFSFVIPTALAVGTVASFVAPYRRVADKEFSNTYVKESTILSNNDGKISENKDIYYYDDGFFSLNDDKFVNENNHIFYGGSYSDSLVYQISDGVDSALAKFTYDSEGKLTFNGVDVGKYIDVNEYDFSEASAIDEKYEGLFDDVLNMILSEEELSSEAKETIKTLAESEKHDIIINLSRYNDIGESTTQVYKNRFWQRAILLVASCLYGMLLYAIYKDGDLSKGTKLSSRDGELQESKNQNIGFWHVGLKYKEAFIKAETDRIKKAHELANEYVADEDIDTLFTRFEKKLTLFDKKER